MIEKLIYLKKPNVEERFDDFGIVNTAFIDSIENY